MTREHWDELELMVDRYSVAELVAALAKVCREKAEHIRVNWQDDDTARPWDRNAARLEAVVPKLVGS